MTFALNTPVATLGPSGWHECVRQSDSNGGHTNVGLAMGRHSRYIGSFGSATNSSGTRSDSAEPRGRATAVSFNAFVHGKRAYAVPE